MKNIKNRLLLTAFAVGVFGPLGLLALAINLGIPGILGDAYPAINAQTKAAIIASSPNGEEVLWEHEVIQAAAQSSPFADNMTGGIGSGKPIIVKNDTAKVAGTSIVVSTCDNLGGDGVQGSGVRVGSEESIRPGDFLLKVDMWFCSAGIENTAQVQTIVGQQWNQLSQKLLATRLAKKQSDDHMMTLAGSATSDNMVFPNGKTFDTLTSADTFSTSLIVRGGGQLKDLGAIPMDVRKNSERAGNIGLPPIQRYLMFLTDQGARPIKTESAYLDGIKLAKERGENNNLFTGEYSVWDNMVIYPWINIKHGGYGSIGSALQPEALLGTAIVDKGTSTSFAGNLDGGGSNAAAAALPARKFFEFFALYAYKPINGLTVTIGSGTKYFAIINKSDRKVSFFSYTGNNGHQLTGLKRLGSTATGDYQTTIGDVTWNTGVWTVAADGNGYMGLSEGAIDVGSTIVQTNSKGTPIAKGFGLGEMAAVCGYGRLPSGKTMANRVEYTAPYGQAKGVGIEVAYGSAAFKRPDGLTPNYVLMVFARHVDGMPVVV